jgi:DNA-binding NarL/FixJ family response regulator
VGDEGHVRLLVIDDDPDICELLRVVSEHHPMIDFVAGVSSPEAAVSVSRQSSPDAILLDHHFLTAEPEPERPTAGRRAMRGLSGLEAVEFLRAVAPGAVIAVYTGTAGLEESVLNAGADMYLLKGPDARAALDEVAAHVVRRRG